MLHLTHGDFPAAELDQKYAPARKRLHFFILKIILPTIVIYILLYHLNIRWIIRCIFPITIGIISILGCITSLSIENELKDKKSEGF